MEPVSTAVVTQAVAWTVSAFMAVSQSFSDGVAEHEKKNYDNAVAAFTKVVAAEPVNHPLRLPALYWRAQGYAQLQKTAEAAADLKTLLTASEEGPLAALAMADYQRVTGAAWDYVDRSTPEKAWASLCAAIRKQDLKALRKCVTGEILAETERMFNEPDRAGSAWGEIGEVLHATLTGIRYNKAKDQALLMFREGPDSGNDKEVIMVKTDGKWQLSEESSGAAVEAQFDGPEKKPVLERPEVALSPAEARQIEALIVQLGDGAAAKRKAAYIQLQALGIKAAALLEQAKRSPDPEIAEQAKRLLDAL